MKRAAGLAVVLAAALALASGAPEGFDAWLTALRGEARRDGISERTLEKALGGIRPLDAVLRHDRRQPERLQDFDAYLSARVTRSRLLRGRHLLREHRTVLEELDRRYGVAPEMMVAIWSLESDYGEYLGDFAVIAALATLAWDERRSDFFRRELMAALELVDRGELSPAGLTGSWAGAIGPLQLMPSRVLHYGVDFDGDGRVNVRTGVADSMATTAHFLNRAGWRRDEKWGMDVDLPGSLPNLVGLERSLELAEWRRLGVRFAGDALAPDRAASLLRPRGSDRAFLVFENFAVLLEWNRSTLYALSVGHMADLLGDG